MNQAMLMSFFRFGRVETAGDLFVPLLVGVAVVVWLVYRYRRDLAELAPVARWTLLTLRLIAVAGLFLFFLQPRAESLVGASRVVVLIDTSASMSTSDVGLATETASETRIAAAERLLRDSPLLSLLGERHSVALVRFDRETQPMAEISATRARDDAPHAWTADGDQTRLGEAVATTLAAQRGAPLAAVIVLTDGAHNAGTPLEEATSAARAARVPIHTIGFGATTASRLLRIVRFAVPERVAPGDPFSITAQIESRGTDQIESRTAETPSTPITAELWLTPHAATSPTTNLPATTLSATKIAEHIFDPSSSSTFTMEVRCDTPGRSQLELRLVVPPNTASHHDDVLHQTRSFEVIDRTQRLLLMPGSPSRDYQFLVEQLARDPHSEADLFAAWGDGGLSQSVRRILDSFPTTAAELAEYDGVIAFDPDWSILTLDQVGLLEEWIARHGGGLVVTAGKLHTPRLLEATARSPSLDKVRAFYPVELASPALAAEAGYRSGERSHPLIFTRDGEAAEFLRLDDDETRSRAAWNAFDGFYGWFATRAVKPAATLDVRVDAASLGVGTIGVVVAEQWYGSGRVVFLGSSEWWRLRRLDPALFERLTTQIIRHATQGKSLRLSDRVSLATDRRHYALGGVAAIHATATDTQWRPLHATSLPMTVVAPDRTFSTFTLTPHSTTAGAFEGFLPLTREGEWTLRLAVPESAEVIAQTFTVAMSDLERENPLRNTESLTTLADQSGGSNLDGPALLSDSAAIARLADSIRVRSHRAVIDSNATERLLAAILSLVLAALLTEWLLRRCWKLA